MPRTFKLLWDKRNRTWYQYYTCPETNQRKKKNCGTGKSRTNDRASYRIAMETWETFIKDLADPITLAEKKQPVAVPSLDIPKNYTIDTVVGVMKAYIDRHSKDQLNKGIIARSTYRNRVLAMRWLYLFLGPKAEKTKKQGWGIDAVIDGRRYAGIHKRIGTECFKEGKISFATAKLRLVLVRQFIKFAYEYSYLKNLPRNLDSSAFHLRKPRLYENNNQTSIEVLTPENIQDLFRTSSKLTKRVPYGLFLLLSLNTGMSSVDLGSLQFQDIEFDDDMIPVSITKTRTKTGVQGNWKLWDITASYLQLHIIHINPYAETNYNSRNPLDFVFCVFKKGRGKGYSTSPLSASSRVLLPPSVRTLPQRNNLRIHLANLFDAANITLSPKYLRKTAASHIETNSNFNTVVLQKFLSHRPTTIARKNYAKVLGEKTMNAEIENLFQTLGIANLYELIHDEMKSYHDNWRS
jgi:integrase